MKRFSISWLLHGRGLTPWIIRFSFILLLVLICVLLLRGAVVKSADKVRTARVSSRGVEIRSEAVIDIQRQLKENSALFQDIHNLIPNLSRAYSILNDITLLAESSGWNKAEIRDQIIVEGSPIGQDTSTLHFTLAGDASPAAVSLLIEHLYHTNFLLRINQVNIAETKVRMSGEFYLRPE